MPREFIAGTGEIEPPAHLYGAVLSRLDQEKNRVREWKLRLSVTAALASMVSLVPATTLLMRGFSETGFSSYLSLLFSDGRAILSFWGEYLLSLIDSLPLAGLASFALALFVFLASIKYVISLINAPREMPRLA
jgi:hypothetical protein